MSFAVSFHAIIENHNILQEPTEQISAYLRDQPNLYKVVLLVNHVFRAVSMSAFNAVLPFPTLINLAICFVGSLFYRLTVETNCAYKFALPAFAGSVALPLALSALIHLVNGAAFLSLNALAFTLASFIPLAAYFSYIGLTVSYDVDHR